MDGGRAPIDGGRAGGGIPHEPLAGMDFVPKSGKIDLCA